MAPDEDEILILMFVKNFELNIRDVCEKVRFQIAEIPCSAARFLLKLFSYKAAIRVFGVGVGDFIFMDIFFSF